MIAECSIHERMDRYGEKLAFLRAAMHTEMQKRHYARDRQLLNFLYKEISVYRFALSEMESLMDKEMKP